MTENPQHSQNPDASPATEAVVDPAAPAVATPSGAAPDAPRTGMRDRLFGIRSVAAVAAASLIIGAGGGALVGVAVSGHDRDGGPGGRGGDRGSFSDQRPGGDGPQGFPGGGPGKQGGPGMAPPGDQQPPSTAPEDDTAPDSDSGATTSLYLA
ncbi:hypothetical protein [Nocardioides sp. R-C-SC26]|uniref:hypothetical protein n=1 Tax=Nocardioides sp. R-C-SC26 TaxID=2870414 RepID=UPI001E3443AE|nr:hypothetical protein [Nocardioides sp. R-C-SC26]